MPITNGKLQIEDNSATRLVEISLPVFPVITTIDLPLDIQKLDDNTYDIFDNGTLYDKRYCEATFLLNAAETTLLNNLLSGADGYKGRGYDLKIRMNLQSGFFPFGPDKGDSGDFTVVCTVLDSSTLQDSPFGYHKVTLRFDNIGSWPSYSSPIDNNYGHISLGTVNNIYYPDKYFNPAVKYNYSLSITEGNVSNWIDKGSISDDYEMSVNWRLHRYQASQILNYLTVTARSNTFTLTTAIADYPFGVDKAATNHTCILSNPIIKITHVNFNEFDVAFNVHRNT